MRVSSVSFSILAAVLLSACGPQERPADFYLKAENAAEFAHALEICNKSGLSQKGKCTAVWQAKLQMDIAEDKALRERALSELGGTTIVPQSPRQAPVSEAASPRKAPQEETATAEPSKPTSKN
jgi:hypothetical protein